MTRHGGRPALGGNVAPAYTWRHPLYATWRNIIHRCENPKNTSYGNYGARGITICAEWRHDFAAFLSAVGERPAGRYSLDRIDPERGYEPGNVRWATYREQYANTKKHFGRG